MPPTANSAPSMSPHLVVPAGVQHLLVPLPESLGAGHLLLHRVAVEDVVVTLAGGTYPDVRCLEPIESRGIGSLRQQSQFGYLLPPSPVVLAELEVADEDLVVDLCPQVAGSEEAHTVQVGDVHTPVSVCACVCVCAGFHTGGGGHWNSPPPPPTARISRILELELFFDTQ